MHALRLALCLSGALSLASSAHAQLPRLRAALSDYSDRAAILEALRTTDPEAYQGRARDESRFLRAAVAADLLLYSAVHGDEPSDVAEALGAGDLNTFVEEELRAMEHGPYVEPARELLAALALLEAPAAPLRRSGGVREDIVFVHRVLRDLREGGAVGRWAAPPCGRRCAAPYDALLPDVRRELAAVGAAVAAAARALDVAGDDPLARALAPSLREALASLRATRAPVALPESAGRCSESLPSVERGAPVSPELVVWAGEPPLVGFARYARISEDGGPQLSPAPSSSLDAPIGLNDAAAEVQDAVRRRPSLVAGLALQPGALVTHLATALQRLGELGVTRVVLLGCTDGVVRGVRLHAGPSPVKVLIRNSGLDVTVEGRTVQVPTGFAELGAAVGTVGPVELRARRTISARTIVELAFASAHEGSVALALP